MGRYHQLTRDERVRIETLLSEGLGVRQIATRLQRSASTLSREVRRGSGLEGYRAAGAQGRCKLRRRGRPACVIRASSLAEPQGSEAWRYMLAGMDQGWSPQQIAGRFRLEHPGATLCHETVYRYIYSARGRGEKLQACLPQQRASRRRRTARRVPRPLWDWAQELSRRSPAANQRSEPGHWELDTVCFSRPGAVVLHLVDRASRFGIALRAPDKQSATACGLVAAALAKLPAALKRSLTCDRGSEFTLLHQLGLPIFACRPYAAWEKGTVEQQNGVLRRYLPRAADLQGLDQEELTDIRTELNHRPMKTLGYRTPAEMLSSLLEPGVALHL